METPDFFVLFVFSYVVFIADEVVSKEKRSEIAILAIIFALLLSLMFYAIECVIKYGFN